MIQLRDYQTECRDAVDSLNARGVNRSLVALPTGTGKTEIIAHLLRLKGRRSLVLAHREELLDQAAARIEAANPVCTVDVEQAARKASKWADIVVASVQTFAVSPQRLDRIDADSIQDVIVDEAHHAIARTYIDILARLGLAPDIEGLSYQRMNKKKLNELLRAEYETFKPDINRTLTGFTATPHRTDGIALQWLFDEMAYTRSIEDMMRAGWLAKIKGIRVDTGLDITKVKTTRGDYQEKDLSEAINTPERNQLAVSSWLAHAGEGRQTIVFCVDVAHVEAMTQAFQDAGVDADFVVGASPKDERRGVIERFKTGKLQVLVNCMVLTEGFDHAATSCILMARPTKSSLLYTQMLGRGTRISEGKGDLLVIDLADTAKAGVTHLNTLFGLPPKLEVSGESDGPDVMDAVDAFEELQAEFPISLDHLDEALTIDEVRDLSEEFNPLLQASLPEWVADQVRLAWVRAPFGYALAMKGYTMGVVVDMLGHSELWCRGGTGTQKRGTKKALGKFGSAIEGLQFAEEWVGREFPDQFTFLDRSSAWHKRAAREPASKRQLYYLRREKIRFSEDISKVDATMLLGRAFAGSAE